MDTKEILKKFWFVALIAVLFVVFIVVYAVNMISSKPVEKTAKQVDGQYIIYSINGENYTADELYDDLKNSYGLTATYRKFDSIVCDKAIETTTEMKNIASSNASYLLSYYGKENLDKQLQSLGYAGADNAYDYYIYLLKSQQLRTDYLKEHEAEYVTPYIKENNPKIISHILVKVADVEKITDEDGNVTLKANPTAEEEQKLNNVLEALKTKSFAEVATEYSDDTSASNGGYLGYFDNTNTSYVDTFKEAAKTVHEGETTEAFVSEYGYHIIYCDTESLEDLYASTDFLNAIFNSNTNLYNRPLVEKANELGIKVTDEELNKLLMAAINPEEVTE